MLRIKMIILICCLIFGINAFSQDKIFSYEIKSVVQNGKQMVMHEGESLSLVTASGSKGLQIYFLDGKYIVASGDALLVSSNKKEETPSSYAGRMNEYSWQRTRNDGSKVPTKLKIRIAFTLTETTFICDMEAGKNIYQYQGVVYDISKPSTLN